MNGYKIGLNMLNNYYVNKEDQNNGDHEVHKDYCVRLPSTENRLFLGIFSTDQEALKEAKKYYKNADGCAYCCPSIHKH